MYSTYSLGFVFVSADIRLLFIHSYHLNDTSIVIEVLRHEMSLSGSTYRIRIFVSEFFARQSNDRFVHTKLLSISCGK